MFLFFSHQASREHVPTLLSGTDQKSLHAAPLSLTGSGRAPHEAAGAWSYPALLRSLERSCASSSSSEDSIEIRKVSPTQAHDEGNTIEQLGHARSGSSQRHRTSNRDSGENLLGVRDDGRMSLQRHNLLAQRSSIRELPRGEATRRTNFKRL